MRPRITNRWYERLRYFKDFFLLSFSMQCGRFLNFNRKIKFYIQRTLNWKGTSTSPFKVFPLFYLWPMITISFYWSHWCSWEFIYLCVVGAVISPGQTRRPPTWSWRWSQCLCWQTSPTWLMSSWGRRYLQALGRHFLKSNICWNVPSLTHYRCSETWCDTFSSVIGVSIVSNSCLNPFIFLFFTSDTLLPCCTDRTSSENR